MTFRALATFLVASLAFAGDAWADDRVEGEGWSIRVPPGFEKQFDSCDAGG